jgi:hypothetical protein
MYFRTKRSGGFDYLQVVESHRVDGKPRQSVVATLGRLDALKASGELDRLVRSGARFTESAMLLSAVEKGEATTIEAKRIGPPLLFERLWRDSFCRAVIEDLLVERKFEFPVEHAIFLTVLHRIMDPGSDRAAEKWRTAYAIGGMDQIDLHHLYRAMSWLGEELADQTGRGLAPRTTKDLIEEQVFSSRRNLFNDVGIEYILGVRERRSVEVAAVLADTTPFVSMAVPKANGRGSLDLQVKEVVRTLRTGQGTPRRCRYIVCYNEAEARNDAAARAATLAKLDKTLRQGDKALVGNKGFRRFLRTTDNSHFTIDPERVAAAARFDGLYVIRTNAQISPLVVALRFRERWIVEDIFRTAKSIIGTRPIFHQRDDTIRGHVFCSFLALLLRKELIDRLEAAGRHYEWADIIRDVDQIVQTDIDQAGRRLRLRAAAPGCAGAVFQAVGVALPPTIQLIVSPPPNPSSGETR